MWLSSLLLLLHFPHSCANSCPACTDNKVSTHAHILVPHMRPVLVTMSLIPYNAAPINTPLFPMKRQLIVIVANSYTRRYRLTEWNTVYFRFNFRLLAIINQRASWTFSSRSTPIRQQSAKGARGRKQTRGRSRNHLHFSMREKKISLRWQSYSMLFF